MDLSAAYTLFMKAGIEPSIEKYNELYDALKAKCDEEVLASFCEKTGSMSYEDIITKGNEEISSLTIHSMSSQPVVPEAAPKKEEKVEEEVEEVVEVSLFGGDDDFF